ncbi:MAG TPA: hypothetical protein VL576_03015 [Candidatus Paceibacterota bacterium]|jgi:uncharacterized membrane protein|nr:hypothetical protein [Candidatus Paceibacterota bacterium]
MHTLAHADTFFFISSIGFTLVFLLIAICLIYLIKLFKSIHRIVLKIEKDIDNIGDTAKELIMQLWDSAVFSWIFGKRRKRKKLD